MRNEDSSTLQYSSLSYSPILLPSSLVFLISRSFKPPFYSPRAFQLKCNLRTQYNTRFDFSEMYSSRYGLKNRSESTLPPWQVTGIREIMRAPYAVIILMNLVKNGFIAQLNQSSHTSKGDIERIRFLLLHAHCNANVTLIPIKSIEMECLLILFHTL